MYVALNGMLCMMGCALYMESCNGVSVFADGCDHGEIYGMCGKSPGPQFSYPAFTFPGPQVQKRYLFVGVLTSERTM
jgi:hypothetical protein